MAVHAWDPPRDPTVYGIIDVDATNALAFVEKVRRESGAKVTLRSKVSAIEIGVFPVRSVASCR